MSLPNTLDDLVPFIPVLMSVPVPTGDRSCLMAVSNKLFSSIETRLGLPDLVLSNSNRAK